MEGGGIVLVVGVVVDAGAVVETVGTVVVPTPGTELDVAPATVVVVAPGTAVDDVVAPAVGVVVVVATAVDVELSGAGSAECADVEVEAIRTNTTSGAIAPTDRTRVRTVENTAAP